MPAFVVVETISFGAEAFHCESCEDLRLGRSVVVELRHVEELLILDVDARGDDLTDCATHIAHDYVVLLRMVLVESRLRLHRDLRAVEMEGYYSAERVQAEVLADLDLKLFHEGVNGESF